MDKEHRANGARTEGNESQPVRWVHHAFAFILGLTVGTVLALYSRNRRYEELFYDRPSTAYFPKPAQSCEAPNVRTRTVRPSSDCVVIEVTNPTDALAKISADVLLETNVKFTLSVFASHRGLGPLVTSHLTNLSEHTMLRHQDTPSSLHYSVDGLDPDSDYTIELSRGERSRFAENIVCRSSFSTPPTNDNLIRNPSFEHDGVSPFVATRFHGNDGASARAWTPFNDGGMRVFCGAAEMTNGEQFLRVHPRSGNCMAQFGEVFGGVGFNAGKVYGSHQAVFLPKSVKAIRIGAWYRFISSNSEVRVNSKDDPLPSIAVAWQLSDGTSVDAAKVQLKKVDNGEEWQYVCVVVRAPRVNAFVQTAHVYISFKQIRFEMLFVDDVSLAPVQDSSNTGTVQTEAFSNGIAILSDRNKCSVSDDWQHLRMCASYSSRNSRVFHQKRAPIRHLKAAIRPRLMQLTLAIPMTADRVLRLETISSSYGGAPVAAAVLVRDEHEARIFTHIWRRRPWLFKHVDVTFVYVPPYFLQEELLPINALRNVALQLTVTEFVMMLDVDMTPAAETFSCFRDDAGKMLSGLLPVNGRRMLTLPVFVPDVHVKPAATKDDILHQLHHRAATTYCHNSQKAAKIDRWYKAEAPYQVHFTTNFEPYGICRRSEYLLYDERFVGYGFNKISWAWNAELRGVHMILLSNSFLLHLNHVDNKWVSHIDSQKYVRTWERYYAFVAESAASHVSHKSDFLNSSQ